MTEIAASLVKTLRERTGAGMMDCKKALIETAGDIETAIDWLRKKGLSAAAKKADRVASEGLIGVVSTGTQAAIIEVNAETDFVGRNEMFQNYVKILAQSALQNGDDVATLMTQAYPNSGKTFAEELTTLITNIGENMSARRVKRLTVEQGVVAKYIHNAVATDLGRIGVLVALESTNDKNRLAELANQIAMHVAATNPQSLKIADLDPALVERERNLLSEQARASGRPEDVINKMIEGRLRKFYEEVVLLEQPFVMDSAKRVQDIIDETAKALGSPIELKAYLRFELGEGIEKVQTDFASEVAAQLAQV